MNIEKGNNGLENVLGFGCNAKMWMNPVNRIINSDLNLSCFICFVSLEFFNSQIISWNVLCNAK